MKLRAKPMVVEAVQWVGENFEELRAFAGDQVVQEEEGTFVYVQGEKTLLGLGDYVFKLPNADASLEARALQVCPVDEYANSFERVCGLCDQPNSRLFVVPEANDARKHGICVQCEAMNAVGLGDGI